jgi:hypothetical protein
MGTLYPHPPTPPYCIYTPYCISLLILKNSVTNITNRHIKNQNKGLHVNTLPSIVLTAHLKRHNWTTPPVPTSTLPTQALNNPHPAVPPLPAYHAPTRHNKEQSMSLISTMRALFNGGLTTKYEALTTKYEALTTKYEALTTKYEALRTKYAAPSSKVSKHAALSTKHNTPKQTTFFENLRVLRPTPRNDIHQAYEEFTGDLVHQWRFGRVCAAHGFQVRPARIDGKVVRCVFPKQ